MSTNKRVFTLRLSDEVFDKIRAANQLKNKRICVQSGGKEHEKFMAKNEENLAGFWESG